MRAVAVHRQRRLRELARAAEALAGKEDAKLAKAHGDRQGAPRGRLRADRLLPLHRHRRVRGRGAAQGAAQGRHRRGRHRAPSPPTSAGRASTPSREDPKRVLVATDCLSEGINLQELLRRGRPLRPLLEPDAPRAARGPRRPLRPAPPEGARSSPSTARTTRSTASCSRSCCASTSTIRATLGISVPVPVDTQRRARGDPRGHPPPRRRATSGAPTSSRFWEREVIEPKRRALLRRVGAGRRAREGVALAVRPARVPARRGRPGARRRARGRRVGHRRPAVRASTPSRAHGATATERPDGAGRRRGSARCRRAVRDHRGDRRRTACASASRRRLAEATSSSGARTRSWTASRPT